MAATLNPRLDPDARPAQDFYLNNCVAGLMATLSEPNVRVVPVVVPRRGRVFSANIAYFLGATGDKTAATTVTLRKSTTAEAIGTTTGTALSSAYTAPLTAAVTYNEQALTLTDNDNLLVDKGDILFVTWECAANDLNATTTQLMVTIGIGPETD